MRRLKSTLRPWRGATVTPGERSVTRIANIAAPLRRQHCGAACHVHHSVHARHAKPRVATRVADAPVVRAVPPLPAGAGKQLVQRDDLIVRHRCRRRCSHRHGDDKHQHAMRDGVTTTQLVCTHSPAPQRFIYRLVSSSFPPRLSSIAARSIPQRSSWSSSGSTSPIGRQEGGGRLAASCFESVVRFVSFARQRTLAGRGGRGIVALIHDAITTSSQCQCCDSALGIT